MKLDQATGLCGGIVVESIPDAFLSIKALKVGIAPSSTKRLSSTGSMPSMPSTTVFRPLAELLSHGAFPGENTPGTIAPATLAAVPCRNDRRVTRLT
jgi:hypothetical protein